MPGICITDVRRHHKQFLILIKQINKPQIRVDVPLFPAMTISASLGKHPDWRT